MLLKNAVVLNDKFQLEKLDIKISGEKIEDIGTSLSGSDEIDLTGKKIIPGLIDIHIHGSNGADACDGTPEALNTISEYLADHGITSFCATTMSLSIERLNDIMKNIGDNADTVKGARIVGINMEGPFVDVKKKGAQAAEHICPPDVEFFRKCNALTGNKIKLVTLSPNSENAFDFITALEKEVEISIGHTTADYDCAKKAMDLGARHVTHLYNAMPPFAHRDPGVIGAACDSPNCMVELISDGYHIHPSTIRTTFKMFGEERVILISDSMMATGMENGKYELGGQEVTMKDRLATLSDGTIAGSATNLFDCMKKAMEFGIPESTAIFAATRNPAKSIGIYDKTGSLTPGKFADVVLVDHAYNIVKVI